VIRPDEEARALHLMRLADRYEFLSHRFPRRRGASAYEKRVIAVLGSSYEDVRSYAEGAREVARSIWPEVGQETVNPRTDR
jgi:hypothetical protein